MLVYVSSFSFYFLPVVSAILLDILTAKKNYSVKIVLNYWLEFCFILCSSYS